MAGLTAAAYLARAGRSVLLCDKEPVFGGLVRSFERGGFVFDAGIRAIENSGIVFPMLRQLRIELEFVTSSVTLGIEDRTVRLPRAGSAEAYERFLLDLFPNDERDVHAIADEVRRIMKYLDVLYGTENPAFLDLKIDRRYLVKSVLPWIVRYLFTAPKIARLRAPVAQYLQTRTGNHVLIDMIAQHFFRGTPTFFAMSYLSLYLDYHYPLGGTSALSQKLVDCCTSQGVTLSPGTEVAAVHLESRAVTDAAGKRLSNRELIWAADSRRLYESVDTAELRSSKLKRRVLERRRKLADKRGGDSVLTLYLAVDLPPERFAAISTGHYFYTPAKTGLSRIPAWQTVMSRAEMEGWLEFYFALTTYEISIPVLRDPSLAPPGRTGLVISSLFDFDVAHRAQEMGWYDDFKRLCETLIIGALAGSIYPWLRESIIDRFSSTPLSIARIAGTTDGAITGWAFTNAKMPAENRLPRIAAATRTPLPHVSQAGQCSYSPSGVPIAILTGKLAADRAIGKLKRSR